jgi:UDPglucose 6-dehydrogenase
VITALGGSAAGKRVALLGLTFKANTDDMRDAPAIDIAEVLLAAGAQVTAYDPEGMHVAAPMLPDVAMAENAYAAATDADAAVVVTEWAEFKTLDFARLADVMAGDALVDLRNILDEGAAQASGLRYVPVGRAA